jgi:aspartyl-tRNA(Asn)/glutamyl-tRNA(Gln) amidotransferase subunit A
MTSAINQTKHTSSTAEPWMWSIAEASEKLRKREISSVELTQAHLDRIKAVDDRVRAYLTVTSELALEAAAEADKRLAADDRVTPLTGIPLGIKDVLVTKGVRTTAGSRFLESFIPPYSATVIKRLGEAGAVSLGKLNMDEFAMGSSTENSAYFPTHNPWALDRVPGGSSGGSAAAVAAGEAMGTLGSDTGGSVRQPGSLTNTVGLKPTYGRVSRFGLIAFASSLDQVGTFSRDARDCALLLQQIAGYDPNDSTSANVPVSDYVGALTGDIRGMRIGVPREYFVQGTEPGVTKVIEEAIQTLKSLGATTVDITLPHTRFGLAAYYIIAPAEASANLARYDGVKYGLSLRDAGDLDDVLTHTREVGFGPEVRRRIMLGTYALSSGYYDAYYKRAEQVRQLIKWDFNAAFTQCDVIISPTSPTVAFKLGERTSDPYSMYLADLFTIPANLAGICGLSMPGGFSDGLPVGVQLLGKQFAEATILRVADAFQHATDYHTRWPDLEAQSVEPASSKAAPKASTKGSGKSSAKKK